jgi:heat shock protein HtpX
MSSLRTAILLAGLSALLVGVGYLLGGVKGATIALFAAAAMNVFTYWRSDRLVLSIHGAQEIDQITEPDLVHMVAELAERAGLPMPRVYLINDPQPNAFATGRDPEHAAVVATTGLLDMLWREEIKGVIAHELAHIKRRDTVLMTVTATIAGVVSMVPQLGTLFGGRQHADNDEDHIGTVEKLLLVALAPLAAMLVQIAISSTREYAADALAARISGDPASLASALAKINGAARQIENIAAERNPATAHLFIINPLSGERLNNLFSTHPSTQDRIAALEPIAVQMGGGRPSAQWPTARAA